MMPVTVFVLDVEEFAPVLAAARKLDEAIIAGPQKGYYRIQTPGELVLQRKPMGLKPALWWSMLTGGYIGHITSYTRDEMRMTSAVVEAGK